MFGEKRILELIFKYLVVILMPLINYYLMLLVESLPLKIYSAEFQVVNQNLFFVPYNKYELVAWQ